MKRAPIGQEPNGVATMLQLIAAQALAIASLFFMIDGVAGLLGMKKRIGGIVFFKLGRLSFSYSVAKSRAERERREHARVVSRRLAAL